ncbi:MAG TPA: VOC family protein [Polyangia bacterium]|jgi:uncharacterized glyoxalase superfamily protein PhnB
MNADPSVTPWIISRDTARLLDFARRAFDAQELARLPDADGSIVHAELRIGNAIVMAFDAKAGWPETPAYLRVFVDDCDGTFRRALEAGAGEVTPPTTLFFGDRVARVRDPVGNLWWLQSHVEDVSLEEVMKRAAQPDQAVMDGFKASLDRAMREGGGGK